MFEYDEGKPALELGTTPSPAPRTATKTGWSPPRQVHLQGLRHGAQRLGNGWRLRPYPPRRCAAKVFDALNITPEEAQPSSASCWTRCSTARPAHGWPGLWPDRIVTLMTGAESIRDVIAFPKTQRAQCLLTQAPAQWTKAAARAAHPPAQPRRGQDCGLISGRITSFAYAAMHRTTSGSGLAPGQFFHARRIKAPTAGTD